MIVVADVAVVAVVAVVAHVADAVSPRGYRSVLRISPKKNPRRSDSDRSEGYFKWL